MELEENSNIIKNIIGNAKPRKRKCELTDNENPEKKNLLNPKNKKGWLKYGMNQNGNLSGIDKNKIN